MFSFDQEARNSKHSYELKFDEMSDGQRALVVLYGLTHLTRGQGYTLLIDEPENIEARSAGLKRSAVKSSLNRLEEWGYIIERIPRGHQGRSTVYSFV